MTDEEKAEENYTKVYLNGDISLNTEEKYFAYTKGYCKGHKDGLAEGRKDFWRAVKNVAELQKENVGLKLQLATSEHDREHNDYELSETYETIEKLKAQIEKMKNCVNCKYENKSSYKHECLHTSKKCAGYENWELAE